MGSFYDASGIGPADQWPLGRPGSPHHGRRPAHASVQKSSGPAAVPVAASSSTGGAYILGESDV